MAWVVILGYMWVCYNEDTQRNTEFEYYPAKEHISLTVVDPEALTGDQDYKGGGVVKTPIFYFIFTFLDPP